MRPPICAVCGRPADHLVQLPPTPESEAWHRRQREEGFVGHPPDLEWYCDAHKPGPDGRVPGPTPVEDST